MLDTGVAEAFYHDVKKADGCRFSRGKRVTPFDTASERPESVIDALALQAWEEAEDCSTTVEVPYHVGDAQHHDRTTH